MIDRPNLIQIFLFVQCINTLEFFYIAYEDRAHTHSFQMDAHSALNLVLMLILLVLLYGQYADTIKVSQNGEQFSGNYSPSAPSWPDAVQPHAGGSLRSDSTGSQALYPEEFVHAPSVYSSMPVESDTDSSSKYTRPFQETCLGQSGGEGCPPGQKLTCMLTPHNQRVCSWK